MKELWKNKPKLSIFHTNICSLNANAENMEGLVHDMDFNFDVLAVTETWNPDKTKDEFSPHHIEGYQKYYGTTGSSSKGGCGVYINESLNVTSRKDLGCWVELTTNKTCNTLVGVFYRHPSEQDSTFIDKLKDVLKKSRNENKKIIICGDFNYNLLNYDKNECISNFLNIMLENNFQPCITEPTRITNTNKPSLVENIFINTIENPISGNILEHISFDHLHNFIIIEHEQINKNIKIKKRDTKHFNQTDFLNELLGSTLIHEIENAHNTNMAYEIFHKKIIEALNNHAPMKYLNKKEIKTRHKPWLTKGILTSIKRKRILFRKMKISKLKGENSDDNYHRYIIHRDMINTLKRKSKRNHYKDYFSNHINNSKKTWKGINQLPPCIILLLLL